MSRRLLLDTGVLIAVERGALTIERAIRENDDIAIAAITVAELMVGVELANGDHRRRRQALVDDLLSAMPVSVAV